MNLINKYEVEMNAAVVSTAAANPATDTSINNPKWTNIDINYTTGNVVNTVAAQRLSDAVDVMTLKYKDNYVDQYVSITLPDLIGWTGNKLFLVLPFERIGLTAGTEIINVLVSGIESTGVDKPQYLAVHQSNVFSDLFEVVVKDSKLSIEINYNAALKTVLQGNKLNVKIDYRR